MTEGAGERRSKSHPVLVVEDSVSLRLALTRILELEGFAVESSGTLADAETMLDGQGVLLLDLELPDGLSTTLIEHAKAHHPDVRIAVLSGAADHLIDQARVAGADVVMQKPIDVPRLLAWLRGLA